MQSQVTGTTLADDLVQMLAHMTRTSRNSIGLFSEFTTQIANILKLKYQPGAHIVCAGPVTPDIEIAADMAEVSLAEVISASPFTGNVDVLLERIENSFDFVYVANPNRVTGANYSPAELERLIQAVPDGLVLVDEYFFDYFGITAAQLLDRYLNVVVFRSFTAAFGISSAESGYMIAQPELIRSLTDTSRPPVLSPIVRKTIFAAMAGIDILDRRLTEVHEESLRISNALSKTGVQSRITATDFLLIRVSSPKDVGNYLAGYKVAVENLDGYPQMMNYLKYRIQSPLSNDKLLKAFEQMPRQYYATKAGDRRRLTLLRGEEKITADDRDAGIAEMLDGKIHERKQSVEVLQEQ